MLTSSRKKRIFLAHRSTFIVCVVALTIVSSWWLVHTRKIAAKCLPFESYSVIRNECYVPCGSEQECAPLDAQYQHILDARGISSAGQMPLGEKHAAVKPDAFGETEGTIALYTITHSGDIVLKELSTSSEAFDPILRDPSVHKLIWQGIKNILPEKYRFPGMLSLFELYTDGFGGEDASTGQAENTSQWVLSVDPADIIEHGVFNPSGDFYYAIVHEYGHLLTLNPLQVPPQPESASVSCKTYFPGEGCALPDSYILHFFNQFWRGNTFTTHEKALNLCGENADECLPLDTWYDRHKAMFVTDYAATDPTEDMAESWAAFIVQKKPTGSTIADKKVRFFYAYPELVHLRMVLRGTLSR